MPLWAWRMVVPFALMVKFPFPSSEKVQPSHCIWTSISYPRSRSSRPPQRLWPAPLRSGFALLPALRTRLLALRATCRPSVTDPSIPGDALCVPVLEVKPSLANTLGGNPPTHQVIRVQPDSSALHSGLTGQTSTITPDRFAATCCTGSCSSRSQVHRNPSGPLAGHSLLFHVVGSLSPTAYILTSVPRWLGVPEYSRPCPARERCTQPRRSQRLPRWSSTGPNQF